MSQGFESDAFEPGPGRLARGPKEAALAQGLAPVDSRGDPFWGAMIRGDERGALDCLSRRPELARSAMGWEGLCYGGFGLDWGEEDCALVWTPAFNAAIQLERFELALALARAGAPLDFTDVAWDRIESNFKAAAAERERGGQAFSLSSSPSEKMESILLQMIARLPAAYATRPDWLVESSQPHHQRHSMIGGYGGLGSKGGAERQAGHLIAFDAALRSGEFGKLPVPAWAGRALAGWAFAANREIWRESAVLLSVRARCVEELWGASMAAGGEWFGEWSESGSRVGMGGVRELLLRASREDAGFALERLPALERLGMFESMLEWEPGKAERLLATMRERRGPALADGVEAFLQAALLRRHAPAAGDGEPRDLARRRL